jgi:hypothetical protein
MSRPSLLTLIGRASFTGWKSAPGEMTIKYNGVARIEIRQVNRKRYAANWATGQPLIGMGREYAEGPLIVVKRMVQERFHQQITPWEWSRNGVPVAAPEEQ